MTTLLALLASAALAQLELDPSQVPSSKGTTVATVGAHEDGKVKVAFVGDTIRPKAQKVFKLIAGESADVVVHLGDFDYNHSPKLFETMLGSLGGVPMIAVIGNHEYDVMKEDKKTWDRDASEKLKDKYVDVVKAHLPGDASCEGSPGLKHACAFRGVFIVLVAPGILGSQKDDAAWIKEKLKASKARWKVCAWHKPSTHIQAGTNGDGVGWDVYDACLEAGAIVATAHEHGYSRTFGLDQFEPNIRAVSTNASDPIELSPNKTFTFVSAAGGRPFRKSGGNASKDWQAKVYMKEQNSEGAGAVFCEFGFKAADQADCYFKDVEKGEIDRWTLVSKL